MTSAIVVGAGAFGSAIARRLARDGAEVTLVEQQSPGWAGSSSGGESRLLRCTHGGKSGEWYARSAWRARELWREVGDVFVECGLAWFSHGGPWEEESEGMLRELGIPVEHLEPAEAARLFPALGTDDLEWVLFEPAAGLLRAERAVTLLAAQAVDAGAKLVRARATVDAGLPVVDGARLEADHVVWACGPWLAELFPGIVELRVTRQEVLFFDAPREWLDAPGWVDYDASAYGHGNLDEYGFKAASDAEGDAVAPDALLEAPRSGVAERWTREYVARRFPPLAGARLLHTRPCVYEITNDTHFLAGPHPEHDTVWLVGGGSGHGFKHAPVLAEHVAALLAGAEPDPRFAVAPRAVDRSLRTAGVRATPLGRRLA